MIALTSASAQTFLYHSNLSSLFTKMVGSKSLNKSEDEAVTDAASDAYSWTLLLLMLRPFKRMPKKGGCCYCGCSSPRRASMLRF